MNAIQAAGTLGRMPREVRQQIWYLVLMSQGKITPSAIREENDVRTRFRHDRQGVWLYLNKLYPPHLAVEGLCALLKTCSLVWHDEADLIFYQINRFRFNYAKDFTSYVANLSPRKRNAVRSIEIEDIRQREVGTTGEFHERHIIRLRNLSTYLSVFDNLTHLILAFTDLSYNDFREELPAHLMELLSDAPGLRDIMLIYNRRISVTAHHGGQILFTKRFFRLHITLGGIRFEDRECPMVKQYLDLYYEPFQSPFVDPTMETIATDAQEQYVPIWRRMKALEAGH